jgi:peptide/nickel transport system substrate-binding protein
MVEAATPVRASIPRLAYTIPAWQVLYATCAKLVDHPDAPEPLGTSVVPDAAASLPSVSADGLTYTFTIRSGLGFSPPSLESVTAASFQRAFERFAKLGPAPVFKYVEHIVGISDYRTGSASSISGVNASGNTLTIQLTQKDGGLVTKLTMPFFCAVPVSTPITSVATPLAMAGPYYVSSASFDGGGSVSGLTISQNPNYGGDRPRTLPQFTWNVQPDSAAAINAVTSGTADYTGQIPPAARPGLDTNYGEGSPPDLAGHRQYFTSPTLGVRFMALNTDPLSTFNDERLRDAVNLVLNRPSLAAIYGDEPDSHYLPPSMPGYKNEPIFPLAGDVVAAQALAQQAGLSPSNHVAVDLYASVGGPNVDAANAMATQLSQIWIDVTTHHQPFGTMFPFLRANPGAYDIVTFGWISDFADPAATMRLLDGAELSQAEHFNFSRFKDPAWNPEFAYASALSGDERGQAYGNLDVNLASGPAPHAAFATIIATHLFSPTLGCPILQPVYWLDLARLCQRQPISPGNPISTGGTPTPSEPLQAEVLSPVSGSASIAEGPTAADAAGYALLGQELSIEAPTASPSDPLVLRFGVDASALGAAGVDHTTVQVLRNGVAVPACTGSPGCGSRPLRLGANPGRPGRRSDHRSHVRAEHLELRSG